MTSNLPATSHSRQIQQAHVRRIETRRGVRAILINKNVKRTIPQRTLPTKTPQALVPVTATRGIGPRTEQKALPQKIRWQEVLKPQTGPTALDIAAKKQKEFGPVVKTLQPGEYLASRIKLIYPPHPMSVGGYIEFYDQNGKLHRDFFEYKSGAASFIEWMQEKQKSGESAIVRLNDFGVVAGGREPRPISIQDNIPQREMWISKSPAATKDKPNRIRISEGFAGGGKSRYFDSNEEYEKEERRMNAKGKNVLGMRYSPQTQVGEFK